MSPKVSEYVYIHEIFMNVNKNVLQIIMVIIFVADYTASVKDIPSRRRRT